MNAKAVFLHPKCEAELLYHNMCTACRQVYDYNLTMKWHEHIQAQKTGSTWNVGNIVAQNGGFEKHHKRARYDAPPETTKLQSKWISFGDGSKIKKLTEE